jgi:hypothetical protein
MHDVSKRDVISETRTARGIKSFVIPAEKVDAGGVLEICEYLQDRSVVETGNGDWLINTPKSIDDTGIF